VESKRDTIKQISHKTSFFSFSNEIPSSVLKKYNEIAKKYIDGLIKYGGKT
jgi:hypothetical protein